ncbi:hypothetical protein [Bradyrhizobium liaoningense]
MNAFLNAFAKSEDPSHVPASPHDVLAAPDGMFAAEVGRLVCSLQIASVLGDCPEPAVTAARIILEEVRDVRCAPLQDQKAWMRAIAWARAQPAFTEVSLKRAMPGREREHIVGAACLRLRKQRYKIEVGAYGPQIAEASCREIGRKAEALIALLGGVETADQILRFLRDAKSFHDGMWLFGEAGLNIYDAKRPMIPVGWLFSLALRFFNRPGSARKPEVAWKSLVSLATDFAAAHDCQRYSQFEDMDPHASQFHRMLVNSTLWREFFTLPQVPAKALKEILDALAAVLTEQDEDRLGFSFAALVSEICQLMDWSADDRLSIHSRAQIEQALPLMKCLTGGAVERVNAGYSDPLGARERTQDSILLFACDSKRAASMPRAFLAAAGCEYVFRLVWSKLDSKRAAEIVGQTLERAIAEACRGKAPTVFTHHEYKVAGRPYELDVATRDEDRIVFIETKGKSLTQPSRSGDMFAFFQDYSDSFLAMLTQLVRHEVHLRQGKLPLTSANEAVADLRPPMKVAVSPLSYGPVSDKLFSSSILRSLVGARLVLVEADPAKQRIIDAFNKRVEGVIANMALVARKKDGLAELFPYLIDVFWLDLGQLLYILDRSNAVWDAFQPLKDITFSSRDFWTEVAHADRGGVTRGRWRPAL